MFSGKVRSKLLKIIKSIVQGVNPKPVISVDEVCMSYFIVGKSEARLIARLDKYFQHRLIVIQQYEGHPKHFVCLRVCFCVSICSLLVSLSLLFSLLVLSLSVTLTTSFFCSFSLV